MFATFGVAYSFGAFFESMAEDFDAGSGATAVFFSLTIGLSFFLALFTGRWADRVGPRPLLLAASGSIFVGLLLTAATPSIWIGYLTYGVGVGFAISCAYVPMVATVGGWFERRRASALGVAVTGIGVGTLVGTPLAAYLIDRWSWRTTYVIFAIVAGLVLLLASFVAERGPAAVASAAPASLTQLLRGREFLVLYVSIAMTSLALFTPFVFIATYATDRGIGDVPAATLVGIIGGASVVGRLGLGGLADRFDSVSMYFASFAVMALSHLLWLVAGSSYPVLVVYTVTLGLGYGGFIALSPVVAAVIFGMDGLGGTIGALYTSAGIGSLLGPPFAGVLIDEFGFTAAIVAALIEGAIAALVMVPLIRHPHRASSTRL